MLGKREWITPITTGLFVISAVTGILMFFHMRTGLVRVAHEWLSLLFVTVAVFHVVVNFAGIKRCLRTRKGQMMVGLSVLILLLCFIPSGGDTRGGHPLRVPVRALAQTPLATLAVVAQVTPGQLRERLLQAGITPQSDEQSLSDLVGQDMHEQVRILGILLTAEEQTPTAPRQ